MNPKILFLLFFSLIPVLTFSQCTITPTLPITFKQTITMTPGGTTLTIPVVIHICHQGGPENISDAQVLSQIDVLNTDYRKRNSDTTNTDSIFKSVAADMEIEFCLATIDTSGNPTTGILRHFTAVTSSTQLIADYGWDNSKYMNIYVTPQTGCFSSFPWNAASDDGIFITHGRFGTTGTAGTEQFAEFATLGRTTTHEVGHYLGLYHTFSFCDTNCYAEDSICDTPPADMRWAVSACMSHATNTCNESPDLPDMVDNFMDYNTDSCANMFTFGQKQRVWDALFTYRSNLFKDSNLVATCGQFVSVPESLSDQMKIFPNPVSDFLNVQSSGSDASIFLLTDITGKELMRKSFMREMQVDLRQMVRGMYLVKVVGDKGDGLKKIVIVE